MNSITALVALSAFIALPGCILLGSHASIHGDGNVETDSRQVAEFAEVNLYGAYDVTIVAGEDYSIEIVTDSNLMENIETRVDDGVLHIDTEGNLSPSTGIDIKITLPDLQAVRAYGSSDIDATGIDTESLEIAISGSGDISVAGRAGSVDAEILGSGDIDASALVSETADASISGSGDITVNASDDVEASIAGSGDIVYIGSPKVSSSVAGSGDVRAGN